MSFVQTKEKSENVESVKDTQGEEEINETPFAYLQEKILTWTIREVTPFGVKHEFNTEGQTSGTLYSAQHIETANIFMKLDGTFEMEARAIEITKEGDQLTLSYKGAGKPIGPTELSLENQAFITTASTGLAQLNNLRIRTEGHINFATREIGIKYYTLKA